MKKNILAFDFDGVIYPFTNGWGNGSLIEDPAPHTFGILDRLYQQGYKIVIFTVESRMEMIDEVRDWMEKYMARESLTFEYEITNKKPMDVLAFIDDRAIRFTSQSDWTSIYKLFA